MLRFTLLACGITWLIVMPLVLQNAGIVSFGLPGWLHALAPIGPVTAAWLMRWSDGVRPRVGDLYRRRGRPRVRSSVTIALALTPVLFLGVALIVARLAGDPLHLVSPAQLSRPGWIGGILLASVPYGLGEEPGWRGWLLPQLQQRHNALRATLILAVIWAGWHAPFLAGDIQAQGPVVIVPFLITLLAGAFWLTFLFNSTGGSVMAAVVWHAAWNAAWLVARPSVTATSVMGMLLIFAGFGVAVVLGRRSLSLNVPV